MTGDVKAKRRHPELLPAAVAAHVERLNRQAAPLGGTSGTTDEPDVRSALRDPVLAQQRAERLDHRRDARRGARLRIVLAVGEDDLLSLEVDVRPVEIEKLLPTR